MPLLQSKNPISNVQRRLNKASLLLLSCLGLVLGIWEAFNCASYRFGYVASYSYAITLALAVALNIVGLPLLIYWRSRWIGAGFITAGILSCIAFYAGMAALLRADRVSWRYEPPLVRFGPAQKASAVIYFRKGTTEQDVEDFNTTVLEESAQPRHSGRDHPSFVSEYLRLTPAQANGHWGVALNFFPTASSDPVNAYLTRIRADERVWQVFLDVAPDSIHNVPEDASTLHKDKH